MANKNLTDLTARTATADSDLIHVNSGGTDYKQAKSDFTKDIVTKITFNNTSLLTSQVEALPNQNYTGYISSAGHVSQTGVPEDTYYWVFVYKLGANNIRIEIRELAPAGHSYHNTKTTQGWSGWILDPTREEITSLNNSLTKSYPSITKYASVTNDAIYVTKIGYIVYVSGYFKVTGSVGSGNQLITFTGLSGQFQLQYIFTHNADNQVSARLETSTNDGHPSLKVSTTISGSLYHYIDAVLVCT